MNATTLALLGRAAFALGLIGMGAVTLIWNDYLLQWQSVPESWPKGALVYVSGALLLAGGAGIAIPQTTRIAAFAMAALFLFWTLVFHAPRVIANEPLAWLGGAEILSLAMGAFMLGAIQTETLPALAPRLARYLYAICPLAFGASHLLFIDGAATFLPSFFPMPTYWVIFTGAAHIAAGLSIASGILARYASALLGAMCACFVLFLHIPRLIGAPTDRVEWTMLAVALAITGAAWCVAAYLNKR